MIGLYIFQIKYFSKCSDNGDYMDIPTGPEMCQMTTSAPVCNGQGDCVCGFCKCHTDSRGTIYGRFCECDNWSCPKSRYKDLNLLKSLYHIF